jgi:hypothetical protein
MNAKMYMLYIYIYIVWLYSYTSSDVDHSRERTIQYLMGIHGYGQAG